MGNGRTEGSSSLGDTSLAITAFVLGILGSVQSLSRVQLLATRWTAALQASMPITNSRSSLKLTSFESVMPSNHLIFCHPLPLPPIFPSIRVFSSESVFPIRWPEYWSFSFSIRLKEEEVVGNGGIEGSSSIRDTSYIIAAFALDILGLK